MKRGEIKNMNENQSLNVQALYEQLELPDLLSSQNLSQAKSELMKTVVIPTLYFVITVVGLCGNSVVLYIMATMIKVRESFFTAHAD